MSIYAVILAAGKGTRMKSGRLKVAHEVAGKPIVQYVVDSVAGIGVVNTYIVVGHQSETVEQSVSGDGIVFVEQAEQLGTGHAVMQVVPICKDSVDADDTVIILAGDCPLIKSSTLESLVATHQESNSSATILTTHMSDPAKYGRILRGKMGSVTGIKEAKDCSDDELKITEINTGVYAFRAGDLFSNLSLLDTNNKQGEYYLTDIIHILKDKGEVVSGYVLEDSDQAVGINTRMDLAKTHTIIYNENNQHFMEEGVTILDPGSTFIDSTVEIGRDTIIGPFTCIYGHSKIGSGCEVGPHCFIRNAVVDDNQIVEPFTKINKT